MDFELLTLNLLIYNTTEGCVNMYNGSAESGWCGISEYAVLQSADFRRRGSKKSAACKSFEWDLCIYIEPTSNSGNRR